MSGRRAFDWVLLSENPLQVHEARGVGCGVEVAAPGALLPPSRVAIARVSPACGALAGEDEVDPAKIGRGVWASARGVVVNSAHGAPPELVVAGGGAASRSALGPIGRARSRAGTLAR